ncbi:cupin domain-containing protein [Microbacterium hatanonis]|jgi:quercetin dioxygenase-like cupin family protein|uniref:Cupin domain-containing protein n=1 Tax=Microbacterium hatanonis TaxID=404366 RepID=A0A5C8I386_9MICO|nr:cupin domain-containing protein [Microbacterium hatanonis]TXK12671.1 cupin domain-containing protein [Microbacterium hatanonis]
MHRTTSALAVATTILLLGGCGVPASSVPDSSSPSPSVSDAPVRAVDIAEGEQADPVEVLVDGGAAGVGVTFREITIEPGASTGEHCHYGQLIAVVESGTLTHYSDTHPGGVAVYETGDSIIEGAGYPHEGRNEGTDDVVLWVTYVIPEGKPLAETDLSHCSG